jgi:hypothetical protein
MMALYVLFECESCENENCTGKGLKATVYKCSGYKHKQTNADKIRSMTDEELASVITDDWCEIVCSGTYLCNDGTCEQHVLKWLKEEVKDV